MDRKEAIRNISLVTGYREECIEEELERLMKEFNKEEELSQLTCFPNFSTKPEMPKPLTPKQYGEQLLNRKKKRK